MRRTRAIPTLVLAVLAGLIVWSASVAPAAPLNYFYSDFNSSLPSQISLSNFQREAIETTNTPNYTSYLPFTAGSWLRTTSGTSQRATLTLTGLPTHDVLDLKFLLGALDSIDGPPNDGPFVVKVDGSEVYSRNFGAGGSSYNPGEPVAIVRLTQLGYHGGTDPWWTDGGFNLGLVPELKNIPHTADSVTIEFSSSLSSPGLDESYAIDNVEVDFRRTPYYQADFNSGLPAEFTVSNFAVGAVNSRARPDADYLDYGFSGNWLRTSTAGTQTATVTLTDLPPHTWVDLDFLLAVLDSMDGNEGPFTVKIDGQTIFSQAFLGSFAPGAPIELVRNVQLGGNLGADPWWRDSAFHLGLLPAFSNIPHSASTMTIEFSAGVNQDFTDESYAIDNLTVSFGVPEPSALLLALAGLLPVVGVCLRRRAR